MGDNQFVGCPAMMNDGRIFSTYVSSQVILDAIKRANGIDLCRFDNNDMRWFLQRNATVLMNKERRYILDNNRCLLPKRPLPIELPFAC
jgi:hypothetical protein